MELQWHKHPLDGATAKAIRKTNKLYRRERGRQGHRFRFDDLRAFWISGDDFAIVSHHEDRLWQLWWKHPDKDWMLQSWHSQLQDAKDEAERPRPPDLPKPKLKPGTYVVAEWRKPYQGNRPIMVRCHREATTIAISGIFQRLGCDVSLSNIG